MKLGKRRKSQLLSDPYCTTGRKIYFADNLPLLLTTKELLHIQFLVSVFTGHINEIENDKIAWNCIQIALLPIHSVQI